MTAPAEGDTTEHLHAVVHDGSGPHALIVHGALASRSYWADNLPALAEVCTPVVVELWGHGRSPSPTEPARYEWEGYAEEFERLRTTLGIGRWYTIGQSLGAGLLLNYGLAHPDRVIAQVVTNSSSAFTPPEHWAERRASGQHAFLDSIRTRGLDAIRDHWINPGRSRRIPDSTRALLAVEFEEHDVDGVATGMAITSDRVPLGDRLADITIPTMLTLGVDEERFLPLVDHARRIPGIEVVEVAAAHAVNAQNPDDWNAAVVDFLRRHRH
ncbi:MAG: alpha/beta hydrolase [Actinomycetota bacterium]